MISIYGTLMPVFLTIALGWVLKRADFPGDHFWVAAERLTYFVFFPALLFRSLVDADLQGTVIAPMASVLVGTVLLVTLTVLGLRRALRLTVASLTSVLQGAIRFNTYVGLAVLAALYGDAGLASAAFCIAILVPLVNAISVLALVHSKDMTTIGTLLGSVLRNPLILACIAGISFDLLGLDLPLGLGSTLEILARAALPLGLLAVGAGLELRSLRSTGAPLLAAGGLKLIVSPLVAWGGCRALGLDAYMTTVIVLWQSLPTATSSYVLARQMGGDATLMASTISTSTLVAFVTMPLMLSLVEAPIR